MMIGSLFAGIGGLELGLERAGLGPVMWQVEKDPFCRQVLAKHWPSADRSVVDVREAGPHNLCDVGIICGGFPCQDVSGAGLGAGLEGERSGLWYQFRRIVRDTQPRFVVVENVASGAARWLCEVRTGLQALGYRTRTLGVAARDVGAPHRRERIFVLAYADGIGRNSRERSPRPECAGRSEFGRSGRDVAYADGLRGVQQEGIESEQRRRVADGDSTGRRSDVGDASGARREGSVDQGATSLGRLPSWTGRWIGENESGLAGNANGIPRRLDEHQWPAGRGQRQHDWEPLRTLNAAIPDRRARVRALGNAVVPQCAYVVGLAIQQMRGVIP